MRLAAALKGMDMIAFIFIMLCVFEIFVITQVLRICRKCVIPFIREKRKPGARHWLRQHSGICSVWLKSNLRKNPVKSLNFKPETLNKAFRKAQWNGLFSTPKVYLLNHERCKSYIQDLPFTPPEKPYKSMKGGVDSTPKV